MPVAFKSVSSTIANGTASVIATEIPAGAAVGDFALLLCVSGNGAVPAAPAGWSGPGTKVAIGSGGSDVGAVAIYWFYKKLDGSEGSSVDAPRMAGHTHAAVLLFTGVDDTTPLTWSAGNTQTPASGSYATDSLDQKANDGQDYFLGFYGSDRDSNSASSITSPDFIGLTGETNTTLINDGTATGGGSALLVFGGDPASDSTGAVNHQATITSAIWVGVLMRVNAAVASGVNFTISNFSAGSPQLGNPAILVSHIFAVSNFSVGSLSYGPVSITQRHALSIPAFSASSPTFGPPTFSQKHAFSIAAFSTASPSIGTPSLGSAGTTALTIPSVDILSLGLAGPTLKQRHGLAISNVSTASPSFGAVTLRQRNAFSIPNFTTTSPELGTPAFDTASIGGKLLDVNILAADLQERVLESQRESRHNSADIEIRVLQ